MSYDIGQGAALPTLSTQRLVLRPLRKTDAEAVAELGGREYEIARWLSGSSWPYQEGDAESFVDQVLVSDPLRHEAVFAITLGGVTIGCIGVDASGELEELADYPSLGYWIGKAFQGAGYATEAAEAVLAWGFEAHGCEAIGARAYQDNEASRNVLKKMGFQPCGSTTRFAEALGRKVKCEVMRLDRKDFDARCGQRVSLPVLSTERLVLRPLQVTDLDRLEELCGNYAVASMLSKVPYPYDRGVGAAYLEAAVAAQEDWPASGQMDFAVSQDGCLIGVIVLRELHVAPGIGYWLGEPFWGRGFMSEALGAALCWLFDATDVSSVRAEVMKDNPASRNVLTKLGFSVVGEGASMSLARGQAAADWHLEVTRQEFAAARKT